ncbi:hypothetical protein [Amycolatopsis echigonensis]|uniref:Uncharacterized protein n=1 Tax=Amycolatopsis echigonensis TaxID=2576905 RepID=A0A8E1W654_9PSEU|nr:MULTISPECIES: hypothetical protein [Amycolatopsis]MBB2505073.1 hypothetical protein [Amycolatopsis echigonensis]
MLVKVSAEASVSEVRVVGMCAVAEVLLRYVGVGFQLAVVTAALRESWLAPIVPTPTSTSPATSSSAVTAAVGPDHRPLERTRPPKYGANAAQTLWSFGLVPG